MVRNMIYVIEYIMRELYTGLTEVSEHKDELSIPFFLSILYPFCTKKIRSSHYEYRDSSRHSSLYWIKAKIWNKIYIFKSDSWGGWITKCFARWVIYIQRVIRGGPKKHLQNTKLHLFEKAQEENYFDKRKSSRYEKKSEFVADKTLSNFIEIVENKIRREQYFKNRCSGR